MPSKGTYTALQQLRPINVDWSEASKILNAEEEQQYKRKEAEKKARKEERDSIGYDQLEPVITGIDSLDKGLTLGIQEASSMQHADYKRAREDANYADSTEYKIRTKNLNEYSKNVKTFSDGFSDLAQKVITKSNDGSLSAWDSDLLQTMNGAYVSEKVKFGAKEDGSVLAYVALTDQGEITDENPQGYVLDEEGNKKMKRVTPPEVFKGLGGFQVTEDVDILKTAQDIGTELGEDIKSSINGYVITSEQSWEDKQEETRKIVRGLLGSPKNPTALAKRMWADEMGESSRSLGEQEIKEIEDKLLDKIKPFYDKEVKKTKNYSSEESARTRAEDRAKESATPAIVRDENTGIPKKIKFTGTKKGGKQVQTEGYAVSFGSDTDIPLEKTNSTASYVKNIYYTDEGIYADKVEGVKTIGDPVLNADGTVNIIESMTQGKGWKRSVTERVELTDTELTNLSKNKNIKKPDNSNFKDSKEFTDFLKKDFKETKIKSR